MNEDETFAALNPVSLDTMNELWEGAYHIPSPLGAINSKWTLKHPTPTDVERFFRKYGWTYKQFLNSQYPISVCGSATWRQD